MIFVSDTVLLSPLPDWETLPEYKLLHSTDVSVGGVGGLGQETRDSIWHTFRRQQSWTVKRMDGDSAFAFEEEISVAQEDKACCVPYFAALNQVESISGLTLSLVLTLGVTQGSGSVMWWCNAATGEAGTVQVRSGAGTQITALTSVPDGLVAGCFIAPLIYGALDSAKRQELEGASCLYTLSITERAGAASGPARTISEALSMALSSVSGEMVEVSPNRETTDAAGVGITLSGALVTVVVSTPVSDAAGVGITLSGTLVTVVLNTDIAESAGMGITISGSLT